MRLTLSRPTRAWRFLSSRASSTTSTSTNNIHFQDHSNNQQRESPQQQKLMLEALRHVPRHGWTRDAIAAAVPNGMSVALSAMVDPVELVSFCMLHYNQKLSQNLQDKIQDQDETARGPGESANTVNPRTRAKYAIQTRLLYLQELLQSRKWHEAMAIGATKNPLQTRKELHELVDIIANFCYHGESTSISLTQHLGLGAVYVSTELFMLTDSSIDYQDTWAFLDQALDRWEQMTSNTDTTNAFSMSGFPFLPTSEAVSTVSTVVTALGSGMASLLQTKAPHELVWNAMVHMQQQK